jgi:hypothetical protein
LIPPRLNSASAVCTGSALFPSVPIGQSLFFRIELTLINTPVTYKCDKSRIFAGNKPKYVIMIIANPIYDTVFKRLMENERVARFFIGTLLEQNVVSLEMNPQEYTYRRRTEDPSVPLETAPLILYSIFRVDFVATVRTETGEQKKILIEVQKAWNRDDLMRFRNYLGEHYKRTDRINGKEVILPITTIYILDFRLPEIESACIKVEREYRDMVNRCPITVKSPFVENLTHDSYVVQAGRITSDRYQTKLDKLLSVFEQAHFIGDTEIVKRYDHLPDDENVREMTDLLHYVGTDPEERRELEMEQEAIRTLTASFARTVNTIKEQEKEIEEQGKALEEKDKVLEEQAKALEEQDKENAELKRLLAELQHQLHKK